MRIARRALLLAGLAALLLSACATPAQRTDRLAARAGFKRVLLEGSRFHHVAYERLGAPGPLFVFIEGDGTPWTDAGRRIAADPTPGHPLALELAAETRSRSVLYLGRPCYFGLAHSEECHPSDWTSARYSEQAIQSLATALNRFTRTEAFQGVVLIGHSGGGTVAVLMAPLIERLRAVVTIGANLDVGAWTRYHGYLPLSASLDPADRKPLPAQVAEIHLVGGADHNVPPDLLQRYMKGHPAAHLWRFASFDHRCCWQRAWPSLLPRLMEQAGIAAGSSRAPAEASR